MKRLLIIVIGIAALLAGAACGGSKTTQTATTPSNGATVASTTPGGERVTLRLGYFPNVTHAQPQTGLVRGSYAQVLGPNVKLDMSKSFNAGPSAMEALLAGEVDATYVGSSPAINAFIRSQGKELRIVAGATSGGALLVVRPDAGINTPADFANKKIASPQLGNTQDVSLRSWLQHNGLNAKEQGGNVTVVPTENPNILDLFKKGDIDGAWVPEPWGTRLIQEGGGKLFLDERNWDVWPDGKFGTVVLTVRTSYLEKHPDVIEALIKAHVEETQWIQANPQEAQRLVNQNIAAVTGKALSVQLIAASWPNQDFTWDPLPTALKIFAKNAFDLGFLGTSEPDISNIISLDLLNKVLAEKNLPAVQGF